VCVGLPIFACRKSHFLLKNTARLSNYGWPKKTSLFLLNGLFSKKCRHLAATFDGLYPIMLLNKYLNDQ
jgi:hypothetical protein